MNKGCLVVGFVSLMGFALCEGAVLTISAFDAGSYSAFGNHDPTNQNYFTGDYRAPGEASAVSFAGFVAFDVPASYSSINTTTGSDVRLVETFVREPSMDKPGFDPTNPAVDPPFAYTKTTTQITTTVRSTVLTDYFDPSSVSVVFGEGTAGTSVYEFFEVHEVLTPPQDVLDGGTWQTAIFDDLKEGPLLGSRRVVSFLAGGSLINLTRSTTEQALIHGNGTLMLGLSVRNAFLFGGSGVDISKVELQLTGEVVPVETMDEVISQQFDDLGSELVYSSSLVLDAIPEPSTGLLILGALGLGLVSRRRSA